MIKFYIILLLMTYIGSIASFYLKKSSSNFNIKHLFTNKYLYMGGILYLMCAFLNIFILKYLDYSVVLPLTSITYIWTLIISNRLLREKITIKKTVGILMIFIGSLIMFL